MCIRDSLKDAYPLKELRDVEAARGAMKAQKEQAAEKELDKRQPRRRRGGLAHRLAEFWQHAFLSNARRTESGSVMSSRPARTSKKKNNADDPDES